ncbi:MAG: hypothetical protein ACXU7D_06670 [Burkholderiaceae bacterium]
MQLIIDNPYVNAQSPTSKEESVAAENHEPILTRFGDAVDVRRRGALRLSRFAGTRPRTENLPAVVRIWMADQCKELTTHQARALAEQLLAAAILADSQNCH